MWDCGMTPTAGCKHVFSSPWYSIYSVDRASDLVWENLLLVLQREKIHHHHYWSLSVHTSVSMQAIVTPAKYYLANCKIYARLNTRQCLQVVFWSSSPIILLSRAVLGFSNNNCTVLLLRSITSFTLFSRAVHVALASFAPSPSFPLDVFWVRICTFLSTEVLSVRVPGGCLSNGCHGYCPGSLVAPFRFTRHLPNGFNLIFIDSGN